MGEIFLKKTADDPGGSRASARKASQERDGSQQ
jgi:hypothetical protein